jgi:hypothetical protein
VPPGAATERLLRVPLREVTISVYDGTVDFEDVDTYALLGLLGAEEFADQELVNRGLRGLDDCLQRLRV